MSRRAHWLAMRRLPSLSAQGPLGNHIEKCLICQAEAARYRLLSRLLATLRFQEAEAPPSFVHAAIGSLDRPVIKRQVLQPSHGVAAALAVAGAVAVVSWRKRRAA